MAKVMEKTQYECDNCGLRWDLEDDAAACCAPVVREVTTYICGRCGADYQEADDAAECCPDEEED